MVNGRKTTKWSLGPGILVTAAFIGPGTLTTASLAGARFGYALIWGVFFSVLATGILQEMSSRIGIVTQKGLGDALRETFPRGLKYAIAASLVISAIVLGNAAYEAGNLAGAALGLNTALRSGPGTPDLWPLILAVLAGVLLYNGRYRNLERILIFLVIIMSLTFIWCLIKIRPDFASILHGLISPRIPAGSLITLIALIGTTVVPYNLFLHASAVSEKWNSPADLGASRLDSALAIGLGGLITISIIVTSAMTFFTTGASINGPADLADQLKPLLGSWAPSLMGIGMFAAGLSSAITAPLAAAYACQGILGWERELRSRRFRIIWMTVLSTGMVFASLGIRPLQLILFAQVANGILLPVIASYLLWVVNNRKLMRGHHNSLLLNLMAGLVVLITVLLGVKSIWSVITSL